MKQKLITLFATLLCSMSMFADGALSGKFTINEYGSQIVFSQGNLQYRQSDNTYRFAPTQYAFQGDENEEALEMIDEGENTSDYIDLFGWGTGTEPYFHDTSHIYYTIFHEWGNEPITNGGNAATSWRTLTIDEWSYLIHDRANAEERFAFGKVNGVNGLIILPDEWETPSGLTFKPSTTRGLKYQGSSTTYDYINTNKNNFDHNTYNGTDWDSMQDAGAVFLPAAGYREGTSVSDAGEEGYYWSSSPDVPISAYCIYFTEGVFGIDDDDFRSKGMSVRLVHELPKLEVYTEFVEETGTLTYYYDKKRLKRTGLTEQYGPIDGLYDKRFEGYDYKVKKAVIDPSMKKVSLETMTNMFYGDQGGSLSEMTTIEGLENLNTTNVTNMTQMFKNCSALTSIDLSSFNTDNVTDMSGMFYHCEALTSLDLSSFNTENVTDMSEMFFACKALTSLDLSSFKTENVTTMYNMFQNCYALTSLDLSSFNTARVTDMFAMFARCKALTSLDLSSFNTARVTDMNKMFEGCSKLKTIYCNSDWSTTAATSSKMFQGCEALVGGKGTKYKDSYIDKTYARPDGGTETPGYFTLKPVNVYTEFDESTGTLTYYYDKKRLDRTGKTEPYIPDAVRFAGYSDKVTKAVIDPSMKDAPLTSMEGMFYGGSDPETFIFYNLSKMKTIEGLENLNTSNVTDMNNMFLLCSSLTSLDLSSFNTSKVTNMNSMFSSCSSLTSLDISTFNTSNVTSMGNMFLGCNALKIVDVTPFDVSKVTNMSMMFGSCKELTTICCNTDWRTSPNLTNSYLMFSGCNKIVGDKGTTYIDDENIDVNYAHPDGGKSDPGYFSFRMKGDADGNGQVNVADIVAISNYMMGNPPAGFSKASADVNLDGIINIADIVALAKILLGGK